MSLVFFQTWINNDKDFLTTKASYKLNLNGPSLDVQTGCSTGIVSVNTAINSILSGECDIALAGGVTLNQKSGYLYQEGMIYSPDGHCRAFDEKAKGTVGGSAVGGDINQLGTGGILTSLTLISRISAIT